MLIPAYSFISCGNIVFDLCLSDLLPPNQRLGALIYNSGFGSHDREKVF
jgi:hypothetical protein